MSSRSPDIGSGRRAADGRPAGWAPPTVPGDMVGGAHPTAAPRSRRSCLLWAAASLVTVPAVLRAACPCGADDDDKDAKDRKDEKPAAPAGARPDGPATQPATRPAIT